MAKYIGIDYGGKRVGTALSDEGGTIAFPRGEILNDEKLLGELVRMIEEEKVGHIIVGDTRAPGGNPNAVTAQADAFMKELARVSGKEVTPASEVWSSVEVSRYAPENHPHDNAAAAAFILQRYLDMHEGSDRMKA